MPRHLEYDLISKGEYVKITTFNREHCRPISYEEFTSNEDSRINRIEISRPLAERIIQFLIMEDIGTRGKAEGIESGAWDGRYSRTYFTVRFSLHIVAGKRGGWFILQNGGREPSIPDEFIEYGPMRKSGHRDHRYRRKLSPAEVAEVRALRARTPSIEQLYRWIVRKYPAEVLNLDWSGKGRPAAFG